MRNLRHCSIRNIYLANDWVQLLELLNKVCDLGLLLLVVVWVVRKNHIGGFGFGGATVLLACRGRQVSFNTTVHGVVVLLRTNIQLTDVSGDLKARKNGFGERFQVFGESGGAQIRLAVLS